MNTQESHGQDTINGNHAGGDNAQHNRSERGKNEDRKIFVGGIPYDVTEADLTAHFSKFGDVTSANVKIDRMTGRSRGFAFVEFGTVEACQHALRLREQTIKTKTVEVKPAKSHENKKVFIGGIPSDLTEEELKLHFSHFGKVEEIEWPTDKVTKQHRNFAFIVFEEETAADVAAENQKHQIRDRECDVKKAVPRSRRSHFPHNGPQMSAYGGQIPGGMPHQQQQWFNIPPMYGQAAGGWGGDWYNNANMANYYSQQGGQSAAQAGAGPGGAPTHAHGGYSGNTGQYPQGGFKQTRGARVFNGGYEGQLNNQH